MSPAELELAIQVEHVHAWRWALLCAERQPELAQDALQNSYLAILDGTARYAGASGFRSFLFGVIRRQTQRLQRRRWLDAWWPASTAAEQAKPADVANPEHTLEAAQLWSALQQLPKRQRELLALVFGHDLAIAEAAVVLNMRLGTARTHYARGKSALRARLGIESNGAG